MNVCVYKNGAFLFEAEYVEDTNDGIVVILDGESKRLLMDYDYDFAHDVDDEFVGILYVSNEGRIESKLIPAKLRSEFDKNFQGTPSQFMLEQWLKEANANSQI